MNRNIRRGRGRFMGMDVLILHTVGRRSRQPRPSPVAWFADGQDAWLIVASGGRRHPDWYLNLMAHPDRAAIELSGRDAVAVTPHRLDGADRAQAWQRITAAQPRYAKYQRNTDREYPVSGHGFITATAVDPFGNLLGIMYNPHYLEILSSLKPA